MAIKIRMREMFDRLKLTYGNTFSIIESDTHKYTIRIGCLDIIIRDCSYRYFMEVSITTPIPTQFCQTHKSTSELSFINLKSIDLFIRKWADAYIAYAQTTEGAVLDAFLGAIKPEHIPIYNRTLRAFGYRGLSQFVSVLSGLANKHLISELYVISRDGDLDIAFYSSCCLGYSSYKDMVKTWNALVPKGSTLSVIPTMFRQKVIRIVIPGGM
jgi:hypothetical protein